MVKQVPQKLILSRIRKNDTTINFKIFDKVINKSVIFDNSILKKKNYKPGTTLI